MKRRETEPSHYVLLEAEPQLQTKMSSSKIPLQQYIQAKLFTAKVLCEETLEKEGKDRTAEQMKIG